MICGISGQAQKGRKESEKPLREASLFLAFSIALLRDRPSAPVPSRRHSQAGLQNLH